MGRYVGGEEEDWVRSGRKIRRDARCNGCSNRAAVAVCADMVVVVLFWTSVDDDEVEMFWVV